MQGKSNIEYNFPLPPVVVKYPIATSSFSAEGFQSQLSLKLNFQEGDNSSKPISTESSSPKENFESELTIICETREFKKRLLTIAIPRKVGEVTGKDLQKARWQAQKWWSQWLFDNIAKDNLDDFRIKRFENDLVSPLEVEAILKEIRENVLVSKIREMSIKQTELDRTNEIKIENRSEFRAENRFEIRGEVISESNSEASSPRASSDDEKKIIKTCSGTNLKDKKIDEIKRRSLDMKEADFESDLLEPCLQTNTGTSSPPGLIFISGVNDHKNMYNQEPGKLYIRNLKVLRLYSYNGIKAELPYTMDQILRNRYSGPPGLVDEKIYLLGLRYNVIGIDNHYLSVPPDVARLFDLQLFGSPFNTFDRPYFSAFPKVERFFGSRGTYFSSPFPAEYNTFIFNPPYDETVIDLAVTRLIQQMWLRPMTVLCTLPVWDAASQLKIGAVMTDENGNNTTDFQKARKFSPVGRLLSCPYFKDHIIKKKETDNPVFYDCVNNKKFAPCNTHLILLSNGTPKITLQQILAAWK